MGRDEETGLQLRRYREEDEAGLLRLWHETKQHAYPYLPTEQAYTLETDTAFFREHLAPGSEIWLAIASGGSRAGEGALLGFMALRGSYLDRLYVHPGLQRSGVGAALIDRAKALRPEGLELHTHQQNVSACSFYEKHGFRPVRWGTSGPPESSPDVLYRWRPEAPGARAGV
jgi:ribosomal protein S18 acetylase RimI-like enzyme